MSLVAARIVRPCNYETKQMNKSKAYLIVLVASLT